MNGKRCCLFRRPVLLMPLAIIVVTLARAADVGPGYDIDMSHMIPVRDGVELEAWITKPSNLKVKAPAILTLTQYDIDGGRHGDSAGYYARRGYVSGRSLNTGYVNNQEYWAGKMLEQYAAYRPFSELNHAIGIAADDWWMLNEYGQKVSMMNMWLNHVGDAAFNLAAEPRADSYARMNFSVLTVTGYYDDDQPGALHYYRNYVAHAPAEAVARHHLPRSMISKART